MNNTEKILYDQGFADTKIKEIESLLSEGNLLDVDENKLLEFQLAFGIREIGSREAQYRYTILSNLVNHIQAAKVIKELENTMVKLDKSNSKLSEKLKLISIVGLCFIFIQTIVMVWQLCIS